MANDAPLKLDDIVVTLNGNIWLSSDEDPETHDSRSSTMAIARQLGIIFDREDRTCRLVAIDHVARDQGFPHEHVEPGEITLTDPAAIDGMRQLATLLAAPGSFTPFMRDRRAKEAANVG